MPQVQRPQAQKGRVKAGQVQKGGHVQRRGEFMDTRHGHNHFYPRRGIHIKTLPGAHWRFMHHGVPFFFSGGVWYRPYGPRFVVVTPPIGLVIPFLPSSYVTIWIGGRPYYYANEVYYTPYGDGYMVVEPPQDVFQTPESEPYAAEDQSQSGDRIFSYPLEGQSQQQQDKDRYECHRWAVNQAGYDPTNPSGGISDSQKRSDYRRAMEACLTGRGYSVK
jgi:hypothetical protein